GLLGVGAVGLQVQHHAPLGGQAEQAQEALAVGLGPVAADPDLGGEPLRQFDEADGGAQMESEGITDFGPASGDREWSDHRLLLERGLSRGLPDRWRHLTESLGRRASGLAEMCRSGLVMRTWGITCRNGPGAGPLLAHSAQANRPAARPSAGDLRTSISLT